MFRVLRTVGSFCRLRYYRELAQQMKINIPPINSQISIADHQKCNLIGYRKVQPIQQKQSVQSQDLEQEREVDPKMELVKDDFGRQELKFSQILDYAKEKQLDVCVIDSQENEVSLERIREKIYEQYYWSKVYKANSTSKMYKEIRVPENIEDHDLQTKVYNIYRLVDRGQKTLKLITDNNSEKSQENLKKLLKILGREEIAIEQEIKKDKKNREIQKLVVILNYESEIKIDYEQVNKKWRRMGLNKQRQNNKKTIPFKHDEYSFQPEEFAYEKQLLKQLEDMNMKFPKKYQQYERLLQKVNESGKLGFIKHAFTIIKDKTQELEAQNEQQQEQVMSKETAQEYLKIRTAQDILQDMQKLKEKSFEMGPYEVFMYKELEKELRETLRKAEDNL